MLNERLAWFDFDLQPASARPFVAVPDVAFHLNGLLSQKLCDGRDGNLVLARLQGKEQIERGGERFEIVSQTSGLVVRDFEHGSNRLPNDCQSGPKRIDHQRPQFQKTPSFARMLLCRDRW